MKKISSAIRSSKTLSKTLRVQKADWRSALTGGAEKSQVVVAIRPTISKRPMDVLEDGLTYSLLSRVRNAFAHEARSQVEVGKPVLTLVDGRGEERTISSAYVAIANSLEDENKRGAELLKSVRTSRVRKLLTLV